MNSILLVIYGQFTGNLFYLLDKKKVIRKVVTSRVCEYLPKILEVGRLRTRYPIVQQHGAGDPAWMEMSALTEVILRPATYMAMFPQDAKRILLTGQRQSPTRGATYTREQSKVYTYAESGKIKPAFVQRPDSFQYILGPFPAGASHRQLEFEPQISEAIRSSGEWNTVEAAQRKVREAGRPDQPQALPFADPLLTWKTPVFPSRCVNRTACFYSKLL